MKEEQEGAVFEGARDEEVCCLTPEAFGARLRQQPPARLELPDGVTLTGASLAAFLDSAHFPYGRYRIGEQQFLITPSPQLDTVMLEALVRSGPGQRPVGPELLVWRRASFRVAAGTASEARDARPFVSPSGARAYLWLGRPLPGGPLVLRDANNIEERVPLPEDLGFNTERGAPKAGHRREAVVDEGRAPGRHGGDDGVKSDGVMGVRAQDSSVTPSPHHLITPSPHHPSLRLAEQALQQDHDRAEAERHLREIMASPRASGAVLAGAGRLWQSLGRPDVAAAAFTMALERGSVEGALGLSRLAEDTGEGLEGATRPLDTAVARNLASAALHARYAELLERLSPGPQVDWHRRQMEKLP